MYREIYSDSLNIVDEKKLLGSDTSKTVTVQKIQPANEYLNGVRTNEIVGLYVTCLCPDGKSIRVKLLNKANDLDRIKLGMRICFNALIGKIYCSNNRLALSCSAEGWTPSNE